MSEVKEKEIQEEKTKSKLKKVSITEKGMERLNEFIVKINKESKREIRMADVIELAVEKLSEKDMRKIQERVYTPDDKMEVMFEEYNQRNPNKQMSWDEFKASMLEVFDKQVLSKLGRSLKTEHKEVGDNG